MRKTPLREWARQVGLSDRGVAQLMGVEPSTVVSWRRDELTVEAPPDWRAIMAASLRALSDNLIAAETRDLKTPERRELEAVSRQRSRRCRL